MNKIIKKTKRFTAGVLCLVVVGLFVAYGCKKTVNGSEGDISQTNIPKTDTLKEKERTDTLKEKVCEVDNPLTDLPWLKALIDENVRLAQEGKYPTTYIYQCTYDCTYDSGNIGFLEYRGEIVILYNCEGKSLGLMGGVVGQPFPSGLKVDWVNQKLLWKVENGVINDVCYFNNPLEDLPWLKKIVEEFTTYSNTVKKRHCTIYQCTYIDTLFGMNKEEQIGFIVSPICADCRGDNTAMLYNCNNGKLCSTDDIKVGFPSCDGITNIDKKKIIWEINK